MTEKNSVIQNKIYFQGDLKFNQNSPSTIYYPFSFETRHSRHISEKLPKSETFSALESKRNFKFSKNVILKKHSQNKRFAG